MVLKGSTENLIERESLFRKTPEELVNTILQMECKIDSLRKNLDDLWHNHEDAIKRFKINEQFLLNAIENEQESNNHIINYIEEEIRVKQDNDISQNIGSPDCFEIDYCKEDSHPIDIVSFFAQPIKGLNRFDKELLVHPYCINWSIVDKYGDLYPEDDIQLVIKQGTNTIVFFKMDKTSNDGLMRGEAVVSIASLKEHHPLCLSIIKGKRYAETFYPRPPIIKEFYSIPSFLDRNSTEKEVTLYWDIIEDSYATLSDSKTHKQV